MNWSPFGGGRGLICVVQERHGAICRLKRFVCASTVCWLSSGGGTKIPVMRGGPQRPDVSAPEGEQTDLFFLCGFHLHAVS